jgi:hypothetical protein
VFCHRGVVSWSRVAAAGFALAIGCAIVPNGDGEPCAGDTDCAGRCEWGYCARGKCKDDSDCPGGWRCEDNGSSFLGLGGGGRSCRPKCAACPPNRQCRAGADPTADCPPSPLVEAKIDRPDELPVAVPVTLTANATSANGAIVAYEWIFDDGTRSTEQTVDHTFARAGPSRVTLTVTDDQTATGTISPELAICQAHLGPCDWEARCCSPGTCSSGECLERPDVSAGGPYSGVAGRPLTFRATASTPNGVPIVSYTWAVVKDNRAIERTVSSSAEFTYTFERGGSYEIDVRAADVKGMEGHAEAPVSTCDPVGEGFECSIIDGVDSCCGQASCIGGRKNLEGDVTGGTCQ